MPPISPRISVVIPAYNRLDMLRRAVISALRQSHADLEVLVVDDGSKQDIAAVLGDLDDPRLTVIRHEVNLGASAARNTGIHQATGDFIAFLDSDDEWLPTMIERQLARFEAAPPETVMVYAGVRLVPPVKPPRSDFPCGNLAQTILVGNAIGTTSCAMVRRAALLEIGGFDEALPSCQDWDLYIRLARLGPIEAVTERLVLYRVHDSSITGSFKASILGHRRLMRKHAAAIAALPPALRARHHLALVDLFLWKRAWWDAAVCLIRAVDADPRALKEAYDLLVARRLQRLLRRGRALLPARRAK